MSAMLQLASEGDLEPSAGAVAERAGVGRRTVFRLFRDMDSLYGEMHAAILKRVEHIVREPIEGTSWRERLDRLIERRVRFYEEILPYKSAAEAHRHRSQFLRAAHGQFTQILREMLLFVLPRSSKDDVDTKEALEVALSFEAWRRLRQEQRLSPKAGLRVVKRIVAALVD
ncbi:MAG: TetR/AcrR family transcriptional regulator [Hyphomonadaceae bacterium]|nr:TetR/AcrR family transcriptional regulator [Hyphomonadaceae bacterium]